QTSPEPHAARWTPYLASLLLLAPLQLNFLYFQTGILLVWLFLLGMRLLPRRPLLAGVVWSLAISIKVIPAVLLPWMLWRRQWRCVLGTLLGLFVGNAAVLGYTGWNKGVQQYQGYVQMLRSDPVFAEYNERYQSLPSLIRATVTPHYESRIESTAQAKSWDGVRNFLGQTPLARHADALVLLAIGLVLAACAWACRPGRPSGPWRLLQEGSLITLAMLLVSPHTWRHYYWWLWPTVLCAVHAARTRRPWAIAIVAVVAATEFLPHRGLIGELAIWYQVFHGHTIGALVVFALLATHLIRNEPEPANTEPAQP
ncbi:MAG TPA: glycosyltransferase family 87 protein, partial [Planctomycetota bacterium]|nr:glycosyltransferase family 87 protein [Planctomycetota bacterium]